MLLNLSCYLKLYEGAKHPWFHHRLQIPTIFCKGSYSEYPVGGCYHRISGLARGSLACGGACVSSLTPPGSQPLKHFPLGYVSPAPCFTFQVNSSCFLVWVPLNHSPVISSPETCHSQKSQILGPQRSSVSQFTGFTLNHLSRIPLSTCDKTTGRTEVLLKICGEKNSLQYKTIMKHVLGPTRSNSNPSYLIK